MGPFQRDALAWFSMLSRNSMARVSLRLGIYDPVHAESMPMFRATLVLSTEALLKFAHAFPSAALMAASLCTRVRRSEQRGNVHSVFVALSKPVVEAIHIVALFDA